MITSVVENSLLFQVVQHKDETNRGKTKPNHQYTQYYFSRDDDTFFTGTTEAFRKNEVVQATEETEDRCGC